MPRLRLEPADGRRRGLFERSEFRSRPICGAKTEGIKRQRGVIFFDYFLLHKQKKVISRRATPDKTPHPAPSPLKNGRGEKGKFMLKTRREIFMPLEAAWILARRGARLT